MHLSRLAQTVFAPLLLAAAPAAQTFPYEVTAVEYLESLGGVEGTFDEFLESSHFLQLDLGAFDIRIPATAGGDKDAAADLREVLDVALRLQAAWGEWILTDADERKASNADVKTVSKWIKRLTHRALAKAAKDGGGSLIERLEADEKTTAAVARLRARLAPKEMRAEGAQEVRPARVVLAPDRRTYVQLVSAIGYLEKESRQRVWTDAHLFTPNAWALWAQVIPLRHPAFPHDVETAFEGWEVERYLTWSFEQHAAQRLAASHFKNEFFWDTDALLETALSTNLEIACLGDVKLTNDFTSFNWSRAGGSTQPYSRFVPGGNSAGGTLPPRKAKAGPLQTSVREDSHIKETGHGAFLAKLRERQKKGAKLAGRDKQLDTEMRREKHLHFELTAGSDAHRIQAPFLGDAAATKPIPAFTFLDDYEDFFTAYRSEFFEWLRTESFPDADERFARLMHTMGAARGETALPAACLEIFGMPLGYDHEAEETLEGNFLHWLSKRR